MGLKYNIFMCRGVTPDELMQKLLEHIPAMVDTSSQMVRHRQWEEEQGNKLLDGGMEFLDQFLHEQPPDEDLVAYANKEWVFQICWMQHPSAREVTVGVYTRPYRGMVYEYQKFLAVLLTHAKINDTLLVDYAHGSDWGMAYHLDFKTHDHVRYEMLPVESERYDLFAKRVGWKTDYPICSWHEYMLDNIGKSVPYTHEASYDEEKSGVRQ